MKIFKLLIIMAFVQNSLAQNAQIDTLRPLDISPVIVTASRLEMPTTRSAYAVTILDRDRLQRGQAQLSLQESLVSLPGVFSINADNFAQDLRIAVRGFGARAAFGIRGLRLFVDGLPESTPDGQADVDNLDVGALQKLEILRGASAGLYGNAAGGIINLATEEPTAKPFFEAQAVGGSFGFKRIQAKTGLTLGKIGLFGSLSHNQMAGYRQKSAMRQTIANLKCRYQLSPSARLSLLLNYGYSPLAEDAGGLTAEQVAADRRQARLQNVQFNTGESVEQFRTGLVFEKKWTDKHSLKIRGFMTQRDFDNRLAFTSGGWVEFDRLFGGGGVAYTFKTQKYQSQIGFDLDNQADDRRRFNNGNGQKGNLTLEQTETFRSLGLFWLHEWQPIDRLSLTAAMRLDRIKLSVKDKFLNDGDQSGGQTFNPLNPSFGFSYRVLSLSAEKMQNRPTSKGLFLYGNMATNFETPTLNELSANPTNLGGFNPDLKPQTSVNYELGLKGDVAAKLQASLAVFQINLRNELVPYQITNQIGRTFFRNAGQSTRRGIEVAAMTQILRGLFLTTNYTYSDFRYKNYEVNAVRFDGKYQPALPKHLIFSELRYAYRDRLWAVVQMRAVSRLYVNDANTVSEAPYTTLALRFAYTLKFDWGQVEPFFGADNLLNASFSNNLLINAVGNRFFEPAANFARVYGGLKCRIG
jgi:iron complex outermembrane receptor protein